MAKQKKPNPRDTLLADAPRKKPKSKRKSVSFSTHKARANWFNSREAWPMREAPMDLLLLARSNAAANIAPSGIVERWEQAGPTNIGGRMTCVIVNPNDVNQLWAGAAGGGVWHSTDGGQSWSTAWHNEPTLNIGSLCLDPGNPGIIYCGTGEANLSADSHTGVGLYRSMDGGTSWHILATSSIQNIPKRIGRIAVDPFDSNHIFISGVGHRAQDARGLFVSHDGGISWARITQIIASPYQCHEVVFHPATQNTIYTTIDARGSRSGVWRSTDGGHSWSHLTSGLAPAHHFSRANLAIAPSNPQILYLQVAARDGGVLGVYRSANGGNTWNKISGTHFRNERQMSYNNAISVDPTDADVVICGGVDLHMTSNAGNSWKKVTAWNANRDTASNYAHADQHALFQPPAQPGLIYALNDGGMDVSTDGGNSWTNRSSGLATNMFYDFSAAASNGDVYGGGLQDNGTVLTFDGVAGNYFETTGGDGGFCAIDPADELHFFTSSQFMRLNRYRQSDQWATDIGPNETGDRPWMAFIAMDPQRPRRVLVGSKRIWRSTTDGTPASWRDVSGILDNSFVSCIEISRADSNVIYVGTENGGIFKSENGGTSWSGDIASSALPGRTITRLRTPANDADVIYATTANYGGSHLYRSTDGGATWDDVDGGNLPDVPHHGIVIPSNDAEILFVANDAGVFVSHNAGGSWNNLSLNLPTVMVVDLVLHEATDTLLAATYGRSSWRLDISNLT